MKSLLLIACSLLSFTVAQGQVLYWDANGNNPGAGINPNGVWGIDAFWSDAEDGASTPGLWTAGASAVFSAGSDAENYSVSVSGTQTVSSVSVEEGNIHFLGGTLVLLSPASIKVAEGVTASSGTTILGGSAGLFKEGPGTLVISNAQNTFSGDVIIKEGVFCPVVSSAFGKHPDLGNAVLDGGDIRVLRNYTILNPLFILKDATFSCDPPPFSETRLSITNKLTASDGPQSESAIRLIQH